MTDLQMFLSVLAKGDADFERDTIRKPGYGIVESIIVRVEGTKFEFDGDGKFKMARKL